MSLTFQPFDDTLTSAAACILAARHQQDRPVLPMLPQRFEDVLVAQQAVTAAWTRPWSSGAVAMLDGEMAGYLFGSARFDQHGGRAVWMGPASYGLADGVDSEIMRDLYAAAGTKWLELGCFDHVVMVSAAHRSLLETWFSLCFGQQQAYGVSLLTNLPAVEVPSLRGVIVRRANAGDAEHLARLCYITGGHQFDAPTWAPTPLEIMAERPNNYRGVASDDDAIAWLAFRIDDVAEHAIGFQIYYEAEPEPDALYVPDGCIELSAAGTVAEERGKGVGLALTAAGYEYARQAGYTYCLTDWRTTNLQSSRFWPQRGFQPVTYRLYRRVDNRIAWANRMKW